MGKEGTDNPMARNREAVAALFSNRKDNVIKPLRLATACGTLFALVGFLYGLVTIIRKIVVPSISAGYSSLMAVILLIGGILMLMLGLLGEYIGRIYISLNNSPQYVIRDEVNFDS